MPPETMNNDPSSRIKLMYSLPDLAMLAPAPRLKTKYSVTMVPKPIATTA